MASFSTISIRFNADLKQFSSQMQNAQRRMQQVGKKFKSVGSGLTTGFTLPAIAALAGVTKGTEELRADLGRLETNAQLAGEKMGFMRDRLKDVQAITGETDSSVEGLSNLLAAGFRGEQLTQALENINGAAIKFSDTLKFEGVADGLQETLATGAAIGPFAELLDRSGVNLDQFNKGLQQSIKDGTQQNFVLSTLADQGLSEINEKYKENNRDVIAARKSQLAFQLAMADLARVVQPIVTRITEAVTGLVEKFNNLEPETKKIILVVAGLAAAVGPLLYGIGTLLTVLPALGGAFAALTGPVGLAVAAIAGIAAVVIANWDRVKAEVQNLTDYFTDLYNESLIFRVSVENIITVFNTLYNVAKLVIDVIVSGFTNGANLILESFKNIGAGLKAILTGDVTEIPKIFARQAAMASKNFQNLFKDIGGDIGRFVGNMSSDIDDSIARIQKEKTLTLKTNLEIAGKNESSSNSPGTETPTGGNGLDGRAMAQSVNELSANLISPFQLIGEKMPEQAEAINLEFLKMQLMAQEFNENFNAIVSNTAANFAMGFAQVIGNAAAGGDLLGGIFQLIGNTIGELAIQVGQMAIGIGTAVEGIKAALQSLSGPVAIAAGIALVALGTFAKSALSNLGNSGGGTGGRRVALADGGLAYGPTNALIGEYANARSNPEVVAPLDKLKGMLADSVGGGRMEVFGRFELQNNKLVAAVKRGEQMNKRRGA